MLQAGLGHSMAAHREHKPRPALFWCACCPVTTSLRGYHQQTVPDLAGHVCQSHQPTVRARLWTCQPNPPLSSDPGRCLHVHKSLTGGTTEGGHNTSRPVHEPEAPVLDDRVQSDAMALVPAIPPHSKNRPCAGEWSCSQWTDLGHIPVPRWHLRQASSGFRHTCYNYLRVREPAPCVPDVQARACVLAFSSAHGLEAREYLFLRSLLLSLRSQQIAEVVRGFQICCRTGGD